VVPIKFGAIIKFLTEIYLGVKVIVVPRREKERKEGRKNTRRST